MTYYCGRCGEECRVHEEDGRDHAPDFPALIVVSDCHREPAYRDPELTDEVEAL